MTTLTQIALLLIFGALCLYAGTLISNKRTMKNTGVYETFDLEKIEAKLFDTPNGSRIRMVEIDNSDEDEDD